MKNKLISFAVKASMTLNALVLIAGLFAFLAVKSHAAEGYVKVSANFGSASIDKIEIASTDIALQVMPQHKPAR